MAIKKTKILDLQSITGIATVGIFTAGATATDAGTAGTSYVKGLIAHNANAGECSLEMYIYKDTSSVTGYGDTSKRILKVTLQAEETFFFETPYPITLTSTDAIAIGVQSTSSASGIGSIVNVQLLGDVDI
jgi:outer membrane receptor protein involved in Fe transport